MMKRSSCFGNFRELPSGARQYEEDSEVASELHGRKRLCRVVRDVFSRYRELECGVFSPNSGGNTDNLFALSQCGSGRFLYPEDLKKGEF